MTSHVPDQTGEAPNFGTDQAYHTPQEAKTDEYGAMVERYLTGERNLAPVPLHPI